MVNFRDKVFNVTLSRSVNFYSSKQKKSSVENEEIIKRQRTQRIGKVLKITRVFLNLCYKVVETFVLLLLQLRDACTLLSYSTIAFSLTGRKKEEAQLVLHLVGKY